MPVKSDIRFKQKIGASIVTKTQLTTLPLRASNIFILDLKLIEKPYRNAMICDVVNIPVMTLSHATSHDFK